MEKNTLDENIEDLEGKEKLDHLHNQIMANITNVMDKEHPPGTNLGKLANNAMLDGISPEELRKGLDFRGKKLIPRWEIVRKELRKIEDYFANEVNKYRNEEFEYTQEGLERAVSVVAVQVVANNLFQSIGGTIMTLKGEGNIYASLAILSSTNQLDLVRDLLRDKEFQSAIIDLKSLNKVLDEIAKVLEGVFRGEEVPVADEY